MKITGNSHTLWIDIDGKRLTFQGEFIVEGFVAYKDTCKGWDPPHQNEPFSKKILEDIIAQAHKEGSKNFRIEFD